MEKPSFAPMPPSYQGQPSFNGQQPMATPGMMMQPGGGVRNARNKSYNNEGKRDWSFGLMDCFGGCGTCCEACWCPCITYGKNKSRLNSLNNQGRPHPQGGEGCGTDCMVFALLNCFTGLGCIFQMMNRGNIRERYAISGNGCSDCMAVWCCMPCAMTQEAREIEEEEKALMGAH